MQTKLDLIVELAKEIEISDPIDWGMLSIGEEQAYRLMGTEILERFPEESLTAQAIIVKLTVENFVLNLKLLQRNEKDLL